MEHHKIMFNGKLGYYPHKKFHLNLIDGYWPIFKRPYPVPFSREKLFKMELDELVRDGVLNHIEKPSAWASPTFIVPKEDGQVQWVSDSCKLNAMLKQKPYPLPKIQDIMNQREKYKYFTKLDHSMFFYCLEFDKESKELYTINTSHRLFCYQQLPGSKTSPDSA